MVAMCGAIMICLSLSAKDGRRCLMLHDAPCAPATCGRTYRKLPRQADRLKVEFPVSFALASKGVKSPNASWGLSSLYSIIHQ